MSEQCCKNPNIARHDYVQWDDGALIHNRVCLRCKAHWYGPEGSAMRYTKQQWDRFVNRAESEQLELT